MIKQKIIKKTLENILPASKIASTKNINMINHESYSLRIILLLKYNEINEKKN